MICVLLLNSPKKVQINCLLDRISRAVIGQAPFYVFVLKYQQITCILLYHISLHLSTYNLLFFVIAPPPPQRRRQKQKISRRKSADGLAPFKLLQRRAFLSIKKLVNFLIDKKSTYWSGALAERPSR